MDTPQIMRYLVPYLTLLLETCIYNAMLILWIESYVDIITAQKFSEEIAMCIVYICTDVYNV